MQKEFATGASAGNMKNTDIRMSDRMVALFMAIDGLRQLNQVVTALPE